MKWPESEFTASRSNPRPCRTCSRRSDPFCQKTRRLDMPDTLETQTDIRKSNSRRPGMSLLRIVVADDHDLMRRGLRAMLETHPGWEICGEAHTGTEAVAKVQELRPHVAILDISMPEMDGLQAARQIRQSSPKTEILVLSMHYSDQLIREVLEAGIRGYVVKSDSDRDLVL